MFYCKLNKDCINPKYFYLWVSQNMPLLDSYVLGIQPRFDHNNFLTELIPIPHLETQQQILTILNEMESERKSLEQMASKAEERAKFVLDGYLNN
jgi:restriction endonuclease S subunit